MKAYRPIDRLTPGTYRINVGPFFYLGSSVRIGGRVSDHRTRLEKGLHPNKRLQEAWEQHRSFEAFIMEEIPRKDHDTDKDHSTRLRFKEHLLIQSHHGKEGCCNVSDSAFYNSRVSEAMKAKWQDPEWRRKTVEGIRQRCSENPVSEETRLKMAEAKKGARNSRARACEITFQGETREFPTATAAALHHGVSQQAMEAWLSGKSAWPKAGGKTKKQNRRLAGMTGGYLDFPMVRLMREEEEEIDWPEGM